MRSLSIKRILDVFVAAVGLIVLSPFILVEAVLIRWKMGSPVLFRQERPGLHGKVFMMHKFRTMLNSRDANGNLLPEAQRLTRLGRILRATSLDELPELWNVLKGDMSIVGPRPLRVEYLDLYTPRQARRHEVRPGITGWAQINGRNAISWEDRFELDVWYVDNRSLWLDIKIIALTAWKVVRREGISAEGHVAMPKFTGSKKEHAGA